MVHAERPIPPIENSREGHRKTIAVCQAEKVKDTGLMWKAVKTSEPKLCMLPEERCRRAV